MKKVISIIIMFLVTLSVFSQDITGRWNGVLNVPNKKMQFTFNIIKTGKAYRSAMFSLDESPVGMNATSTTFKDKNLIIKLSNFGIEYEGILGDNDTITGSFKQGGAVLPLNLSHEKIINPYPYTSEKVTLETETGTINGSLLIDDTKAKQPLVILHSGSGPTDRDCNQLPAMENNSLKFLAEGLHKQGIASLRYDKRGVAKSRGSRLPEKDLLLNHFIEDLKLWISKYSKDSRFSEIIIAGHSEGALIGLIASINNASVKKYISIAGISGTISDILRVQLKDSPQHIKNKAYSILDSLEKGEEVADVPGELLNILRPSIQPYTISHIKYRASNEIKKLNCPILIIQGDNDLQIGVENANELVLAQPKAKKIIIKGMTHSLKNSPVNLIENIATGYNPNSPIDIELVAEIVSFIKK